MGKNTIPDRRSSPDPSPCLVASMDEVEAVSRCAIRRSGRTRRGACDAVIRAAFAFPRGAGSDKLSGSPTGKRSHSVHGSGASRPGGSDPRRNWDRNRPAPPLAADPRTSMIIVLKPQPTPELIQRVLERIEAMGFTPHLSQGVARTIIG